MNNNTTSFKDAQVKFKPLLPLSSKNSSFSHKNGSFAHKNNSVN